jgi:hypothetical protein
MDAEGMQCKANGRAGRFQTHGRDRTNMSRIKSHSSSSAESFHLHRILAVHSSTARYTAPTVAPPALDSDARIITMTSHVPDLSGHESIDIYLALRSTEGVHTFSKILSYSPKVYRYSKLIRVKGYYNASIYLRFCSGPVSHQRHRRSRSRL